LRYLLLGVLVLVIIGLIIRSKNPKQ